MNCQPPSLRALESFTFLDSYDGWLDAFKKKKKRDPTLTGLMIKDEKTRLKSVQERARLAEVQAQRTEAEKINIAGAKVSPAILIGVAALVSLGVFAYLRKRKRK